MRTPAVLDEEDQEIRRKRIALWDKVEGPRVGDFVYRKSGELHRFTVLRGSVQAADGGSFYFGGTYMEFSGGCGPLINLSAVRLTDETRDGACWFFSHHEVGPGNGVTTTIPCRVYRET